MKAKQVKSKATAITLQIEKVDATDAQGQKIVESHYRIIQMTGALIIEDKWRVGDSMTEDEAILLTKSGATVTVGR